MLVQAWHALAAECIAVARMYAEHGRYEIPGMPGDLLRAYDRILEGHLPTVTSLAHRLKDPETLLEKVEEKKALAPGGFEISDEDVPATVRLLAGHDRLEVLLGAMLDMVLQEPQVRTQAKGGRIHADCRLVLDGKEVRGLTVGSFSVEYADPDPLRATWACPLLPIVRLSVESKEAKTCGRPDAQGSQERVREVECGSGGS